MRAFDMESDVRATECVGQSTRAAKGSGCSIMLPDKNESLLNPQIVQRPQVKTDAAGG
jgi:hypothetical protein